MATCVPPGRSSLTRLRPPDVIWTGRLPLGHRAAKWGFPGGLSYSVHYRQCTSVNAMGPGGAGGHPIQVAFHSKCIVAVWDLQDVAVLRR